MSPKSLLLTRPPFPSRWSSIPISLGNLNLANTLPVGQSFLWHRCPILGESCPSQPTVEYSRAIDLPPRVVCLRQSSAHLFYTAIHTTDAAAAEDLECGTTRRWLEDYFQLEAYPDLEGMYSDWRRRDPDLFGKTELDARAIGVRVLRQDPWECLIAFVGRPDDPKLIAGSSRPPTITFRASHPSCIVCLSTFRHLYSISTIPTAPSRTTFSHLPTSYRRS